MDNSVLNNISTPTQPSVEEFIQFKQTVKPIINLDLTNYKNKQMERRILTLMNKSGYFSLSEYANDLQKDENLRDEFVNMLTINVSEFFRNTEKFIELEQTYIKELFTKKSKLKVWSAGCSIGAEIYSLAMIFDKLGFLDKVELVASDFDNKIIQKASSGIYNEQEVGTVPDEYKKYFTNIEGSKYPTFQIDKRITSKVRFERRDLLNSTFERDFDLVLCRNVVIYFTDEAKDKLYVDFFTSMSPGAILFIGSTERINGYKEMGYDLRTSFFYQKPE